MQEIAPETQNVPSRLPITSQIIKISSSYCEQCEEKHAKYVCPRCTLKTCSVGCYKQHNNDCLKGFQLTSAKNTSKPTQQSVNDFARKMKDFKMEEENLEFEYAKQQRLQELEQMVDENTINFDKLTLEEQQEFLHYAATAQLEEPWQPFWMKDEGKFSLFVEEIQNSVVAAKERQNFLNAIMHEEEDLFLQFRLTQLKIAIDQVKSFQKIYKKGTPHPTLKYHFINILYGAIITFRYFDGDVQDNPLEVLEFMANITDCYAKNVQEEISSVQIAIDSVTQNSMRLQKNLKQFFDIAIQDLIRILSDKFFILELFIHVGQLLLKQQEEQKSNHLNRIKMKTDFMSSFAKDGITAHELNELRLQALAVKNDKAEFKEFQQELGVAVQRGIVL